MTTQGPSGSDSSWKRFFRRKSPQDLQEEAAASELERTLTARDLALMGIGAMVGAGIFTGIGVVAAEYAGPSIVISFIVSAVAAGLTALCYAELASALPVSGSAYSYTYATLGELLAWIVGWNLLLEYLVGNMAVAVSWSSYFTQNILPSVGIIVPTVIAPLSEGGTFDLFAFLIVVAVTALLIWGVRESAKANNIMVAVKLGVLFIFIAVGAWYVRPENLVPFAPHGWVSALGAAPALLFFSFIGFDAVSTAAEETKDPQKNMPRGILGGLLVTTVIYLVTAFVLTGMVAYGKLNVGDPLARAFAIVGQPEVAAVLAAGAIAATTSVLLVFQLGTTRIFFSMARDGFLPDRLTRIHPRLKTPVLLTVIVGLAVALPASVLTLEVLITLTNIGTLFAFAVVMAGLIALRIQDPDLERHFEVPFYPWVPVAGIALTLYLIASLPLLTILRFFAWLGVGLMLYGFYGAARSQLMQEDGEDQGEGPGEGGGGPSGGSVMVQMDPGSDA